MSKTCHAQSLQLDNQFKLIEQSVKNIYDISEKLRPSVVDMWSKDVTDDYINQFQKIAITIADNTEGAIAVYYRINPELNASGKQGFFWVKSPESGVFQQENSTDILAYDSDDVEHVGWYYIPAKTGNPVWMDPYYNANINIQMISYVVPVYDGDDLVGVVGMDIDFERLIDITESIDIYRSNGAVLLSGSNDEVYYNNCDAFGRKLPDDLCRILNEKNHSDKIIMYNNGKDDYGIHYNTLSNNMKILVYAKKSDINDQAKSTIIFSIIVFIVVFVFDLVIAMRVSRRMTRPIIGITEAAKKYARGEWDAEVVCDTNDELSDLTENISIMARKTKEYIEYINDMAKKDALTGLRNKTDYMLYVGKIKDRMKTGECKFSVVVFDVNNLKTVNDTYGHEKGDELIVLASRKICKFFAHSPIFRIGGDEFVSFVDAGDYDDREEILADFKNSMEQKKGDGKKDNIIIACGMSTYGVDGNSFEELFRIADERMYSNKVELKKI